MFLAKILFAIQLALYVQPDAKVANGLYWTEFWINISANILN